MQTPSPSVASARKGIVLAGGAGTRLHPLTVAVSKQHMPVYDKPMIYYPISVLMLAGIREILVISTPHDLPTFRKLLGDGSGFGVRFSFAEQQRPEGLPQALTIGRDFLGGSASALILGDNLFFGNELGRILAEADRQRNGATIFACELADVRAYGVVHFDAEGGVLRLEEKPPHPTSRWAIPGLYFFDPGAPDRAAALKPSARGETEITDLLRAYLDAGMLHAIRFGRGTAWLDTGTHDSLLEASHFVQTIQKRQGLRIACLEEIALQKGWLTTDEVARSASALGQSSYATYLRDLVSRVEP